MYVRGEKTSLWMLQNFKNHCSLRFPPPFFATQRAAVQAAGYEAGEGFIKLPYDRELPAELLKALMRHGSRSTKRPAPAGTTLRTTNVALTPAPQAPRAPGG